MESIMANTVKNKAIITTLTVIMVISAIICAGVWIFYHYYNMLDKQPWNSSAEWIVGGIEDETDADLTLTPASESEIADIEGALTKNLTQMEQNSQLYSVDAFNILAIGVDSRNDSFSGRSDAMILFSIDKKTKRVVMTSFLRDTYVYIPGYGSNRLNAAYAYGGESLLTETFRANYGIEVDRCVTVNFYVVMDLVDAVGGVDIALSADVIGYMNNYIAEHNALLGEAESADKLATSRDGSVVHLNGKQALAYSRVRYVGTDFARTGRQREVIMLCLEKIKKMSFFELNDLAEQFLPRIRTDLTEGDCASLLLMALSASDYEVESMYIPMDGTWNSANIRGMAVLTVDFDANSRAWYNLVQGDGN